MISIHDIRFRVLLLVFSLICVSGCSPDSGSLFQTKNSADDECTANEAEWFAVTIFGGKIKIPNRYIIISKTDDRLSFSSPGGLLGCDLVDPFGLIDILNSENVEQRLRDIRSASDKVFGIPKTSKALDVFGIHIYIDFVDIRGQEVSIVYFHDQSQILFISDDDPNLWKKILMSYARSIGESLSIDEINDLLQASGKMSTSGI